MRLSWQFQDRPEFSAPMIGKGGSYSELLTTPNSKWTWSFVQGGLCFVVFRFHPFEFVVFEAPCLRPYQGVVLLIEELSSLWMDEIRFAPL